VTLLPRRVLPSRTAANYKPHSTSTARVEAPFHALLHCTWHHRQLLPDDYGQQPRSAVAVSLPHPECASPL